MPLDLVQAAVHGLRSETPKGSKSVTLRVTSVSPRSSAVAAINPSANDPERPDCSARAAISA